MNNDKQREFEECFVAAMQDIGGPDDVFNKHHMDEGELRFFAHIFYQARQPEIDRLRAEIRAIIPNLIAWEPSLADSESIQRLRELFDTQDIANENRCPYHNADCPKCYPKDIANEKDQ